MIATYTLIGRMEDGWTNTDTGLTSMQIQQIIANCLDMCDSMEIRKER